MKFDRFDSLEEIKIDFSSDEFCEGEKARIKGFSLTDNPYQSGKSKYDWIKGWVDRDMILSSEGRKDE